MPKGAAGRAVEEPYRSGIQSVADVGAFGHLQLPIAERVSERRTALGSAVKRAGPGQPAAVVSPRTWFVSDSDRLYSKPVPMAIPTPPPERNWPTAGEDSTVWLVLYSHRSVPL